MSGTYPSFKAFYSHEELVEHVLLIPADLELVLSCQGDANRCGMALLLKGLGYLLSPRGREGDRASVGPEKRSARPGGQRLSGRSQEPMAQVSAESEGS
jgi:hypothetical protein